MTTKKLIIKDDRIDILQDDYNIIEKSIHGENIFETIAFALRKASEELDMDNMDALNVLDQLAEVFENKNQEVK